MAAAFQRRSLSSESWENLFDFLDPARPGKRGPGRNAEAEARFAEITRKLVYFFASRSCRDAEDLATETTLRVAAKCTELSGLGFADRIGYFYGVARNVLHEWQRDAKREWTVREAAGQDPTLVPAPGTEHRANEEKEHQCLEQCMGRLTRGARRLILEYYGSDKAAKIVSHRELAKTFGKSLNALRIEVHRIRNTLRQCVVDCVHPEAAGTTGT